MCNDAECIHTYRISDVWSYLDMCLHFKRSEGGDSPIMPYKVDWEYLDTETGMIKAKRTLFREQRPDEEVIMEAGDATPFEAEVSQIGTGESSVIVEPTDVSIDEPEPEPEQPFIPPIPEPEPTPEPTPEPVIVPAEEFTEQTQ